MTFKISAERFALGAVCHENRLTKRENVFERKNAAKRNVANRPLARDVGWLLTFVTFAELPENNLREPKKITEKRNEPRPQQMKQQKEFIKFYNFLTEKS